MVQQAKIYQVENVTKKIKDSKSVGLVDYQGLSASQNTELRQKIRQNGGTMEVVKNTLITRALAAMGIELDSPLTGPTALVYSNEDAVSALKAAKEIAEEFESPKFKLGIYEQKLLPLEKLKKLVDIPGKDVLLSKLANGLNSPLVKLANGLSFNQRKLVLVLKSLAKEKQEE